MPISILFAFFLFLLIVNFKTQYIAIFNLGTFNFFFSIIRITVLPIVVSSFNVLQVPNRSAVYWWCSYVINAFTKIWHHPHCCSSCCPRFWHRWWIMGQVTANSHWTLGRCRFMGICFTTEDQIWVVTVPLVQFNGYVIVFWLWLLFTNYISLLFTARKHETWFYFHAILWFLLMLLVGMLVEVPFVL